MSKFSRHEILAHSEVTLHLGWRDLRSRYAQTKIGPWWSASSLLIVVIGISLSTGLLTGNSALDQSPKIAVAMGFWTLISAVLSEATDTFVSEKSILLNTKISETIMTVRLLWRNYLLLLHNSAVMFLFLLITGASVGTFVKLLVLITVFAPMMAATLFVPALFFSRFGALNRDVKVFLNTAIQLNFFLTPILWDPPSKGTMHYIFLFNPMGWAIQFSKEYLFKQVFPAKLFFMIVTTTLFLFTIHAVSIRRLKDIKKFL